MKMFQVAGYKLQGFTGYRPITVLNPETWNLKLVTGFSCNFVPVYLYHIRTEAKIPIK